MAYKDKISLNKLKILILFFSVSLVILIPLIFDLKEDTYGGYYGFPVDWLVLYPNGFGFLWIGFILDVVIFYFVTKTIVSIFNKDS